MKRPALPGLTGPSGPNAPKLVEVESGGEAGTVLPVDCVRGRARRQRRAMTRGVQAGVHGQSGPTARSPAAEASGRGDGSASLKGSDVFVRKRNCVSETLRKERLATRRRVPPGPRGAAGQTVQRPAVLDPSQGRGRAKGWEYVRKVRLWRHEIASFEAVSRGASGAPGHPAQPAVVMEAEKEAGSAEIPYGISPVVRAQRRTRNLAT